MKRNKIIFLSIGSIATFVAPIIPLVSCANNNSIQTEIIVDKTSAQLDPAHKPDYYCEFTFTLPEQPVDDLVSFILINHKSNKTNVEVIDKKQNDLIVKDRQVSIRFNLHEQKQLTTCKFDLTFIYKNMKYQDQIKNVKDLSIELISLTPFEETGFTCLYAYEESLLQIDQISPLPEDLPDCWYSSDGQQWKKLTLEDSIIIHPGQKLYLKGYNPQGWKTKNYNNTRFNISGAIGIGGNVMSLINNSPEPSNEIPCDECFTSLFENQKGLVLVSKNFLPATKLKKKCYYNMFKGCDNLTNCPDLPATELEEQCYSGMFQNCYSLIEPMGVLPAEVAKEECYYYMFASCIKMQSFPVLKLKQTAKWCCFSMFYECESVQEMYDDLSPESLAEGCFYDMFSSCQSITKAPTLKCLTLSKDCYNSMFYNCTNLSQAPDLNAEILEPGCYCHMFSRTALTKTPAFKAKKMAENSCEAMFSSCILLQDTIDFSVNFELAERCFYRMYDECISIKEIHSFGGQTKLAKDCFRSIFESCVNITRIEVLFKSWKTEDGDSFTDNWFLYVNEYEGRTFVCPKELTPIFDPSHIPVDYNHRWTIEHPSNKKCG